MNDIVVFGYTGFIGNFVYEYFDKKGCRTLGFNKDNANLLSITDKELALLLKQIKPAHYILTSAITRTEGDTTFNALKNINMIHKLINAIKISNPKSVIYLSAADVYGKYGFLAKESARLEPITPYGASKAYSENILQIELSSICPVINLRIPGVFSYGDNNSLIGKFTNSIINNQKVVLSNSGAVNREYLSIQTLLDVIHEVVLMPKAVTLNLACADSVSMIELVGLLESLLNKKAMLEVSSSKTDRDYDLTFDKTNMFMTFPWLSDHTIESTIKNTIKGILNVN